MGPQKELQRVEAFSDGVFAIACTLLILEIKVPHLEDLRKAGTLGAGLRAQWPSFLAYLLSFASIFIAWAGHHRALGLLVRVSKPFIYANGLLLLSITFLPFPTAVLAEYINTSQANMAVVFYSGTAVVMSCCFQLWFYTMGHPVRLFAASVTPTMLRRMKSQMRIGWALVAATMLVAWWFPILALVLMFVSHGLWIVLSLDSRDTTDS